MKLAIVTAGAVGAYFGARFVRQDAQVGFVARGAHLEALRRQGLTIKTAEGETRLEASRYSVTDNPAQAVKGVDLVLFAVKSYDTHDMARAILPGLGENTPVLSLQNGVENEEILAAFVEKERTAGGVAYIFAQLEGPGVVSVPANTGRLVVAERTLAGSPVPHLSQFLELCRAAGVPCETTPDIARVKWTKLVFNSALNGWTTLNKTTLDRLLADPDDRAAFVATMQETVEVARAAGVRLDPDVIEKTLALAGNLGSVESSMLGDFKQGRRLEVEALNGIVVRKGRELGVPTPYNQMLMERLSQVSD